MKILKKPEIYSYDELLEIKNFVLASEGKSDQTTEILDKFICAIQSEKDSKAVFFMPENTFAIFSLIQGDDSICNIELSDVEKMISALENNSSEERKNVRNHLAEKLNVLKDFLKAGNAVKPVVSQADCFETIRQ